MSKKKRDPRRARPPAELKAIWDKVPKMEDCKGKCQASCGPIPTYSPERKLIEGRTGKELKTVGNLRCSMLTAAGACSVYSIRPLICRLWGAVDHPAMRCPEGCKPERWLTHEEAMELFRELEAVSDDEDSEQALRQMMEALSPTEGEVFSIKARQVAQGKPLDPLKD